MSARTLVNHGDSSNRIDIVFLGDGYTESELSSTYTDHVNSLVSYLFDGGLVTQPFGQYYSFFNIHLIDVVSNESGADNPETDSYKDTALNASYYWDGATERLLYVDGDAVSSALATNLSGDSIDADLTFVTVNGMKYGGGGGEHAVYAGGHPSALDIAVHEAGHSFVGLADEYTSGGSAHYSGAEPSEANVTTDPTGSKWSQWIGYEQEDIGTIETYEGGRYSETGIYRPSENSKMRSLEQPFDAVAREAFILEFYEHVDPIDSYTHSDATGTLTDIDRLSVSTIDADIINVDWYLNDSLAVSSDTSITMAELGATEGMQTITAKAYDDTAWVRGDRSALEQSVSWTVTLTSPPVGDFAGPVWGGMQSFTVTENSSTGEVIGRLTASDIGTGVAAFAVEGGTAEGLVDVNASGTLSLTAAGKASALNDFEQGANTFGLEVTASDGAGNTSDPTTVSLSVEDAPDQAPITTADTAETTADGAVTLDVADNDIDPDGGALRLESVVEPANGSAEITADGQVRYKPTAGFTGNDVFNYTVLDDEGETGNGQVTITVLNPDDVAPRIIDPNDDGYLYDSMIERGDGTRVEAEEAQLYRAYVAAMGRLPDEGGYNWWLNEIQQGPASIEDMAAGFINSEEFRNKADSNEDSQIGDEEFILHMYEGVFDRSPDQAGLAWWLNELDTGARSQTEAFVDMTQSNEYVENTVGLVADMLFI